MGANRVQVDDIQFFTSNSVSPPAVSVAFGRTTATDPFGYHEIHNVQIGGYASRALIYSIGSEQNKFYSLHLYLNGGGAKNMFYTPNSDDYALCSCPNASNTDLRFYGINFDDFSPDTNGHAGVYMGGTNLPQGTSGEITFFGGYISEPNATAFLVAPKSGATMSANITVQDVKVENASYFAQVRAGSTGTIVQGLHFLHNGLSSSSAVAFFSSPSAVVVDASEFISNNNRLSSSNVSTIGALTGSVIFEPFSVTVTNPFSGTTNFIYAGGSLQSQLNGPNGGQLNINQAGTSLSFIVDNGQNTYVGGVDHNGGLLVDSIGHTTFVGGRGPTLSSGCGTGASFVNSSGSQWSDNAGRFVIGANASTCILTFSSPWSNLHSCIISPESTSVFPQYSTAPGLLSISNAAALSGKPINYHCF